MYQPLRSIDLSLTTHRLKNRFRPRKLFEPWVCRQTFLWPALPPHIDDCIIIRPTRGHTALSIQAECLLLKVRGWMVSAVRSRVTCNVTCYVIYLITAVGLLVTSVTCYVTFLLILTARHMRHSLCHSLFKISYNGTYVKVAWYKTFDHVRGIFREANIH